MNENQMKDTTIGTASLPISQVLASGFVGIAFFLVCECRCEPSCEDCHQTVWNSPCHCQERCQ